MFSLLWFVSKCVLLCLLGCVRVCVFVICERFAFVFACSGLDVVCLPPNVCYCVLLVVVCLFVLL